MEMYRPVFDHDAVEKLLPKGEHILRVKVSLKLENYVEDAEQLLSESKGKVEIVALGRAMIRAISVAEILRRKGGGLHKEVKVYTLNVNTLYVPLEEGLRERNEAVHHNVIAIVLSWSARVAVEAHVMALMEMHMVEEVPLGLRRRMAVDIARDAGDVREIGKEDLARTMVITSAIAMIIILCLRMYLQCRCLSVLLQPRRMHLLLPPLPKRKKIKRMDAKLCKNISY